MGLFREDDLTSYHLKNYLESQKKGETPSSFLGSGVSYFLEDLLKGAEKTGDASRGFLSEGYVPNKVRPQWEPGDSLGHFIANNDWFDLSNASDGWGKGWEGDSYSFGNVLADEATNLVNYTPIGWLQRAKLLNGVKKVTDPIVKPLAERIVPEMPNDIPGFYGSENKGQQALSVIPNVIKMLTGSINRQLNPFQIRQNKLFRDEFITSDTQKVLNKHLDFLDSPEVTKNVNTAFKNLDKKGKEFRNEINKAGKKIEGALGWNYLTAKQYHKSSKLLDTEFMPNNYFSVGAATSSEIRKGLSAYKPWVASKFMTPTREDVILKHIRAAQGINKKDASKTVLFLKNPKASNASGDMIANIHRLSTNRKIATKVIRDRGKPFDTAEDLAEALRKAGIKKARVEDGAVWFQDSFKSSAYELGGVNNVSFMDRKGVIGSTISDKNDLFGLSLPGADEGITLVPTYFQNVLKPLAKSPKKEEIWKKGRAHSSKGDSKAIAGLTKSQIEAARRIAAAKGDELNWKDYLKYGTKVGGTSGMLGLSYQSIAEE